MGHAQRVFGFDMPRLYVDEPCLLLQEQPRGVRHVRIVLGLIGSNGCGKSIRFDQGFCSGGFFQGLVFAPQNAVEYAFSHALIPYARDTRPRMRPQAQFPTMIEIQRPAKSLYIS